MSEEQLVYKKKKKKFKIFPIVNVIFFILVSLLILFPMWKVIVIHLMLIQQQVLDGGQVHSH